MAFDEGLAQRIREHLERAGAAEVSERRMFGGLSFLVAGNMCVGVIGEELIARVGPEGALALPGGRPMDFTGTPMRGWITVEQDALASDTTMAAWIDAALAFVRTLPPKGGPGDGQRRRRPPRASTR
jgi:TfoX/Sxy family transcriptional regulator of competence genes